jgi:hypothetical protein
MKTACVILLLTLAASSLPALDLWQYPETAEAYTLFIGGTAAAFSFTEGFMLPPPVFHADWMLPFRLPLSLGAYFVTPMPNLKSFGIRAAWHIDLGADNLDLYFLYVFDLGFLRNARLTEYGDEEQERRYYDFRGGVRRRIGRFVCLVIETGFKLQSVHAGISIQLR